MIMDDAQMNELMRQAMDVRRSGGVVYYYADGIRHELNDKNSFMPFGCQGQCCDQQANNSGLFPASVDQGKG